LGVVRHRERPASAGFESKSAPGNIPRTGFPHSTWRIPPMSDTIDRTLYHDESGVDGDEMPGGGPQGHEAGKPRSPDRIITSSGEAPTGGTPVGGASDRVIPGKA